MTDLLQRAIREIEKLPAEKQNVIAERILAGLEDEEAWAANFDATSDEQWDRLADLVRRDIVSGDVVRLEEVFPSGKPGRNNVQCDEGIPEATRAASCRRPGAGR